MFPGLVANLEWDKQDKHMRKKLLVIFVMTVIAGPSIFFPTRARADHPPKPKNKNIIMQPRKTHLGTVGESAQTGKRMVNHSSAAVQEGISRVVNTDISIGQSKKAYRQTGGDWESSHMRGAFVRNLEGQRHRVVDEVTSDQGSKSNAEARIQEKMKSAENKIKEINDRRDDANSKFTADAVAGGAQIASTVAQRDDKIVHKGGDADPCDGADTANASEHCNEKKLVINPADFTVQGTQETVTVLGKVKNRAQEKTQQAGQNASNASDQAAADAQKAAEDARKKAEEEAKKTEEAVQKAQEDAKKAAEAASNAEKKASDTASSIIGNLR